MRGTFLIGLLMGLCTISNAAVITEQQKVCETKQLPDGARTLYRQSPQQQTENSALTLNGVVLDGRFLTPETVNFLSRVKVERVIVSAEGRILAFSFAELAPGTARPPVDAAMSGVRFDSKGRLASWSLAAADSRCRYVWIEPLQAHSCQNINCPIYCMIDYVEDPETGDVVVTCPCVET